MASGSRYFDTTSCQAAFDLDHYALDPRWIGSQDCIFLECPSVFGRILYRG
jgi:hypothetical protein